MHLWHYVLVSDSESAQLCVFVPVPLLIQLTADKNMPTDKEVSSLKDRKKSYRYFMILKGGSVSSSVISVVLQIEEKYSLLCQSGMKSKQHQCL